LVSGDSRGLLLYAGHATAARRPLRQRRFDLQPSRTNLAKYCSNCRRNITRVHLSIYCRNPVVEHLPHSREGERHCPALDHLCIVGAASGLGPDLPPLLRARIVTTASSFLATIACSTMVGSSASLPRNAIILPGRFSTARILPSMACSYSSMALRPPLY
jgi:hypothetical protein